MPDPLYTPDGTSAAFQLRWSLALFPRVELPPPDRWLTALREATEKDGVRLLECERRAADVWLFLLSTRADVSPPQIVKSCKGRLQYLIRDTIPQAFRRNFSLVSIGDANRKAVERYVSEQLAHHRIADPRVVTRLQPYQMQFPEVDLSRPLFSGHGRYICSFHLVLIHAGRWRQASEAFLDDTRNMVLRIANKRQHRLSRIALLPDHLHLAFGAPFDQVPQDIALAYLNNLGYAHGMQPVYQPGYYIGTFGEYDMNAVRHSD